MTSKEIIEWADTEWGANTPFGVMVTGDWLAEIAYQLAIMNERQDSPAKSSDNHCSECGVSIGMHHKPSCHRQGILTEPASQHVEERLAGDGPWQQADWICPGCRTRNMTVRSKCRNCHRAKPETTGLAESSTAPATGSNPSKELLEVLTILVDAIDPNKNPDPRPLDELIDMGRAAILKARR